MARRRAGGGNGGDHGALRRACAPLALVAGRRYALRVDYYDHTDRASAKLLWASAHQERAIIPATQLYPVR